MAENLHLALNERGNYNLVHERRVYNLKHTNMQDKQLKKDAGVQSTRTLMWTQSWIGEKNALKRRAAEELKTIPQIYHEKASSASADLETADFRQLSSSWRFHPTGECRKENLSILSEHSVWSMDGTFKIVPEWYKDLFTYHHPDPCTAGDISGGQHARLLFPFLPSSSTEGDGSWDANQLHQ
ncbi:hypothetical protein T05_15055 [Trichinella murrelli]|uniref:Uncharacterized protein n=1 Tax=Trichinella murrelli TaxID=144512 RepID=A0A0V0TFM7_9BILA|nr:hypothetical protein T05_15055 [Trichinella murrelli]